MSVEIENDDEVAPRADLYASVLWIVFGGAIAIGSWNMDRLEHMHINPYEIPALVPGLLGSLIAFLGAVLAVRAIGQGGLTTAMPASTSHDREIGMHMARVFGLTLFYALGLVGTGLPFWLVTFLFVSVFIGILDRERQIELGRSSLRQWARALIYGAIWSAVVSLCFEYIFLVRLP